MAVAIAEAAQAEDVRRYARAFDAASAGSRTDPQWPCPHCFVTGVTAALQPLTQAGVTYAMHCVLCGETLQGDGLR